MAREKSGDRERVTLGHISGVHGVKGWVKVHSMTEPREAIFEYQPWMIGDSLKIAEISQGKRHGKHLVAQLKGVTERDQAEALVRDEISVFRDQFPELPEDTFYWADLIGLTVRLENGETAGQIKQMLATGANDVMVVQGEREMLIPFVTGQYVKKVDLSAGEVLVDWDPDF